MISTKLSPATLVRVRESTVALLVTRKLHKDETLDAVCARLASSGLPDSRPSIAFSPPTPRMGVDARRQQKAGKYGLELFGETLHASTLPELFGGLIDRLVELDLGAIERLSMIRSTKRGFASREKTAIHPGRPDLPLHRTRSGWWISANIGEEDLQRALKRTCEANDLVYDRDIRFLGKSCR